jgi:branched-chain amino acid transport system substrate-binding protein
MRVFKIVTLLLVAALPACGPFAMPAPPEASTVPALNGEIKVAILAPLSGPAPSFGISTRDGALLAMNEWNARGGVLGSRVVPVVEGSGCSPEPAAKAAHKVIDLDHVRFIVGEVCSGASIAISQIANAGRVIQISPTSTEPLVTVAGDGQTRHYVFRACFTDDVQGLAGARFARQTLNARTAFVLSNVKDSYSSGLAGVFEKAFTAQGGTIVGRGVYTGTVTDFSATLSQVAQAKPDVVYLPDFYGIPNLVTKQAREKGVTATFLGSDGWDSANLDTQAADGSYFTDHYWPGDPRPEAQGFAHAYGAQFKDGTGNPKVPDGLAALAYDATNILLQAIQNAGTPDNTDQVAAALEKLSYDAVSGPITFDAQHNPVKPVTIVAIKAGKPVFDSQVAP